MQKLQARADRQLTTLQAILWLIRETETYLRFKGLGIGPRLYPKSLAQRIITNLRIANDLRKMERYELRIAPRLHL